MTIRQCYFHCLLLTFSNLQERNAPLGGFVDALQHHSHIRSVSRILLIDAPADVHGLPDAPPQSQAF